MFGTKLNVDLEIVNIDLPGAFQPCIAVYLVLGSLPRAHFVDPKTNTRTD